MKSLIDTQNFCLSDQIKSDCKCYSILQQRGYESIRKEIFNQPHFSLGSCQLQPSKGYGPGENIPRQTDY